MINNCVRGEAQEICLECENNYVLTADRRFCHYNLHSDNSTSRHCEVYEATEDPTDGLLNCIQCEKDKAMVLEDGLIVCIETEIEECSELVYEENEETFAKCMKCNAPYVPSSDGSSCTVKDCLVDEIPCAECKEDFYLNINGTICTDNPRLEHCKVIDTNGTSCKECKYDESTMSYIYNFEETY